MRTKVSNLGSKANVVVLQLFRHLNQLQDLIVPDYYRNNCLQAMIDTLNLCHNKIIDSMTDS